MMTKANTPPKTSKQPPVKTHKLDSTNPKLKYIGGSNFDAWNNILANQALCSGRYGKNPDAERTHKQQSAPLSFLAGIEPKDELEGMLAAQLLASHNAAMECYRRAMISEQTFEGRKENLSQANKLSRTHATLLEALNRHRGKGQQKVTVEHVHVHDGGQAIVGNIEGGWGANKIGESTPCTWICTGRNVAERERGAGSRVSHQPWLMVGAECMAVLLRVHRRAIGTHSSTGAILRRQLRTGDSYRRCLPRRKRSQLKLPRSADHKHDSGLTLGRAFSMP
jgi:hypothetical protein